MQRKTKAKRAPRVDPAKNYKAAVEAQIAAQDRLKAAHIELNNATKDAQDCDQRLQSARGELLNHAAGGLTPRNAFY